MTYAASAQVFVLRTTVSDAAGDPPATGQGIWSFQDGVMSRVAPFYYRTPTFPEGSVQLSRISDRLVLQGRDYYEFDSRTGRLITRYRGIALPGNVGRWLFAAEGLSASEAQSIGLAAGYYGFPRCAQPGFASGGCAATTFPGYGQAERGPRLDLLLRRPDDPSAALLEPGATLPVQPAVVQRAGVSFDTEGHRAFLWRLASDGSAQLSSLPVSGGTFGTPSVITDFSPAIVPVEITYAAAERAFYAITDTPDGQVRSLLRRAEGGAWQELTSNRGGRPLIDGVTALSQPPATTVQLVPAIGSGPGANGTRWKSDVWLFNPADASVTVQIRRVARPNQQLTFAIAAHASFELPDALQRLGGGVTSDGGDGTTTDALVVTATYRPEKLAVYSRTWTGTSGTYGQSVPAVPAPTGYSTALPDYNDSGDTIASAPAFIIDNRVPGRFRHNVGAVNDSDDPVRITLGYGGFDESRTLTVPPHTVLNQSIDSIFPATFASSRPPRLYVNAERAVPVWMSSIDNTTGDASFVPFAAFALASGDDAQLKIPAVANTPGANGTFWRTDVFGYFPPSTGEQYQHPRAILDTPSGGCPATTLAGEIGWSSQQISNDFNINVFPNVVAQFNCGGSGALRVRGASWMAGYSRTYTVRPDGGTYGDILPFYPPDGFPRQDFSGLRWASDMRVNVGIYNGLGVAATNHLRFYNANGIQVAERSYDLPPGRALQVPLSELLGDAPFGLYGLSVTADGARTWAYVSIVDNITGDPTNLW